MLRMETWIRVRMVMKPMGWKIKLVVSDTCAGDCWTIYRRVGRFVILFDDRFPLLTSAVLSTTSDQPLHRAHLRRLWPTPFSPRPSTIRLTSTILLDLHFFTTTRDARSSIGVRGAIPVENLFVWAVGRHSQGQDRRKRIHRDHPRRRDDKPTKIVFNDFIIIVYYLSHASIAHGTMGSA